MAGDELRDVQELMQGVRKGQLSRREFIKRAAALGLSASAIGAFLAACGATATATAVAPAVNATVGAAVTNPAGAATAAATTVTGAATSAAGAQPTRTTAPAGTGSTATRTTATAGTATRTTAPAGTVTRTTGAAGTVTRTTGAATGPATGTIKLYSSFPRTGANKTQSDGVVNSIRLALEQANYRAGNFQIVYGQSEDLDDGSPAKSGNWDAAVEAANAQRVIADPDAMVYMATFNSGAAKVSIPLMNQAGMGMISPSNTYTGLTKNVQGAVEANEPEVYYPTRTRNYCRVVPTDDLQGAVGANYARELNARRVFVLDDSELYGRGLAGVFAREVRQLGIEVNGPESIDIQASDYRSLAQRVRSSGADMIYYGGITGNNAGKLWKDLRSVLGANFKMMGPDGIFDQEFLEAAEDAAEGTYISFGGVPPERLTGKGAQWYQQYKAKYGIEPASYSAYGYEVATVVLDAIQRAGRKDRAAIREALLATRNWNGVLGNWSFDQNGDTTLTVMSINQVKNGQHTFVKTAEAARR